MPVNKKQLPVPWYRWQFSFPVIIFIALFGWLAWDSIQDRDISLGVRLPFAIFFGCLVVIMVCRLWIDRRNSR